MRRLPLLTLVVVFFASTFCFKEGWKVWAASTAEEGKNCIAPKEWGQLKGVADRSIAFEDSSGTIRVLDLGPCMRGQTQLISKINRP
jgi:hypothetical protein